jgi:hypothetical protein
MTFLIIIISSSSPPSSLALQTTHRLFLPWLSNGYLALTGLCKLRRQPITKCGWPKMQPRKATSLYFVHLTTTVATNGHLSSHGQAQCCDLRRMVFFMGTMTFFPIAVKACLSRGLRLIFHTGFTLPFYVIDVTLSYHYCILIWLKTLYIIRIRCVARNDITEKHKWHGDHAKSSPINN